MSSSSAQTSYAGVMLRRSIFIIDIDQSDRSQALLLAGPVCGLFAIAIDRNVRYGLVSRRNAKPAQMGGSSQQRR